MLRDVKMEGLISPIAISIVAFALGYQLRPYISPPNETRRTISSSSRSQASSSKTSIPRASNSGDASGPSDASDSESDEEDTRAALASGIDQLRATAMEEVKLVLVVNDSLKMAKGKIAAQAGHATLACALLVKDANPRMFRKWQSHGQPKIVARCQDATELEALAAHARSLNLCARVIQDAGRTQVAAGSKTILGIGPGPAKIINQVTGKLRLL